MIRRVPILTALALMVPALSSCSTFDVSVGARVNGEKVNEKLIAVAIATGDSANAPSTPTPDATTTTAATGLPGDKARAVLTVLIEAKVAEQVAAKDGVDLTASRNNEEARLTPPDKAAFDALSVADRNLLLDAAGGPQALNSAQTPAPTDLEQRYQHPGATGYVCARYIRFGSEQDAKAAQALLAAGTSFADVADQINPQSNGGVLASDPTTPCVSLDQLRGVGAVADELLSALLSGTPGVPIGPVETMTSSGPSWFLFLLRPFAEIGAELTKAVAAAPAFADYNVAMTIAQVDVTSRYGVWDPVSDAVVANP